MRIDDCNLNTACASRERARYAFNGVRFERNGTVTTDGRALAYVAYPPREGAEERTVPPFTLKYDDARVLEREARARGSVLLDETATAANGAAHFALPPTRTRAEGRIDGRKEEGTFPEYARLVPRKRARVVLRMNAALLRAALDTVGAAAAAGRTDDVEDVEVHVYGPEDAVMVKARRWGSAARRAFAIVMPFRR